MKVFERGSSIILEFNLKKRNPFSKNEVDFDPIDVSLTIYDPDGNTVVNREPLQRHHVGKYFYILNTTTDFKPGLYSVKLEVQDAQNSNVFEDVTGFELK